RRERRSFAHDCRRIVGSGLAMHEDDVMVRPHVTGSVRATRYGARDIGGEAVRQWGIRNARGRASDERHGRSALSLFRIAGLLQSREVLMVARPRRYPVSIRTAACRSELLLRSLAALEGARRGLRRWNGPRSSDHHGVDDG